MIVRHLTYAPLLSFLIGATGCFRDKAPAPTVFGIYKLAVSDTSIHHGVDMLVLNSDSTYVHLYTHGSSGKDLTQSGNWKKDSESTIGFSNFVAWDLFGPLPDGVMYPEPAGTAFPLSQGLNGNYEIEANSDRGETWVQVDRSPH